MALKQVKLFGVDILNVDGTYDGTAGGMALFTVGGDAVNFFKITGAQMLQIPIPANSANISAAAIYDGTALDAWDNIVYYKYGPVQVHIVPRERIEYVVDL